MLSLDDALWGRLEHAYGKATNIPDFLLQLKISAKSPSNQRELWHSLWGSLCHQGTVYTASYAAVPHIVQTAMDAKAPIDFGFFALPACIEVARHSGHGPEIPGEIADSYHHSLARLGECVFLHRNDPWDRNMLKSAGAAQAIAKGDVELAEVLLNLDNDWIARIVSDSR